MSGFFITVALTYTGGLQGTGDTRSPLFITLISQVALPLGICFMLQQSGGLTPSASGRQSCSAISRAACSRSPDSSRGSGNI